MNRQTAEAIVLLNTINPDQGTILKIDEQGRVVVERVAHWQLVNSITATGAFLTDEFKRKIVGKAGGGKEAQRKVERMMGIDSNGEYYATNRNRIVQQSQPSIEYLREYFPEIAQDIQAEEPVVERRTEADLGRPPLEEEGELAPVRPPPELEVLAQVKEPIAPAEVVQEIFREMGQIIAEREEAARAETQAQNDSQMEAARIARAEDLDRLRQLRREEELVEQGLREDIQREERRRFREIRLGHAREIAEIDQHVEQLKEQLEEVKAARARERELLVEVVAQVDEAADQVRLAREQVQTGRQEEINRLDGRIAGDLAREENEPEGLSLFERYIDDLQELYDINGYSQEQRRVVDATMRLVDEDTIVGYLTFARGNELPVTYEDYLAVRARPAAPDGAPTQVEVAAPEAPFLRLDNQPQDQVGPVAAQPVAAPQQPPDDPQQVDPQMAEQQDADKATPGGATEKLVFKKRYHEIALQLYFQNSSYPQWDPVLESNIMALDISTKEIDEMIDTVIKTYGDKLGISKRFSSTLEELNEVTQLKFCLQRSLHMGPRSRTATVKLSDLENLQRVANGAGTNAQPNVPLEIRNPQTTSELPMVQTKEEYNFVNDFDRREHLRALHTGNYIPKQMPKQAKSRYDARNIGIVPGNNLQSVKDTKPARVINRVKFTKINGTNS